MDNTPTSEELPATEIAPRPDPIEIETVHRDIKILFVGNPTPSLMYLHIISTDGVHQNFYLNKEHLQYLHERSGKVLDDMK